MRTRDTKTISSRKHSNVAHGDTSLTAPVQPENKTGYHFDHWEDQNNTAYTFGSPVTGDTTVHAFIHRMSIR